MPTENTPASGTVQVPAVPPVVVPDDYPQTTPEDWFAEDEVEDTSAAAAVPAAAAKPAPVAPPPPPAPETHTHKRWVERAAIKLGLSDEEILTTPPDALEQKLFDMQERAAHEARSNALAADRRPAEGARAEGEPNRTPAPPVDKYAKFALDPDGGWDETFSKPWNAMVEHLKAQDAEIARLNGTAQQFQAREAATVMGQVEGFFSKYPDVYMPGGQRDDFRCEAVCNALNGFLRTGKQTSLLADLERAHKGLFGSTAASPPSPPPPPAADSTREAIKDAFRNGGMVRPTQRNQTPLPKGRAAAIAAGNEYLKEHSLNGVDHDDDPEDTLP